MVLRKDSRDKTRKSRNRDTVRHYNRQRDVLWFMLSTDILHTTSPDEIRIWPREEPDKFLQNERGSLKDDDKETNKSIYLLSTPFFSSHLIVLLTLSYSSHLFIF